MNHDLIFKNLEICREYLNCNLETFSIEGGRSGSYYRNKVLHDKQIPDLDFMNNIAKACTISIGNLLSKELIIYKKLMVVTKEGGDEK